MALTLMLIVLLVLFLINVPIAFALIVSTSVYFFFNDSFTITVMIQRIIGGLESVPLLAIVFFITAGILMNYTGITSRMLKFAEVITRPLPGALAQVNVVLATLMGGISGSNLAEAAMQAKMIVPEMEKKGYSKAFATTLTGAAALITPIIPPGVAMIMYGYVGNVSIGKLFLAGVLPGVALCIMYMIYIYFYAKKHHLETDNKKKITMKEFLSSFKDAILALILPVIIIGGIRMGIFSATEAGAIAVLYALILGLLVYREMKIKHLMQALLETAHTAASILIIIGAGSAFGWALTLEQVPQKMTELMVGNIASPTMFFIVVLVFLLIVGMFVEGNVSIIILTPLFMPMLMQYGIDPVHFGIFFIICLSIGTMTPPLGTIMFVTCAVTGTKVEEFVKESWPFLVILIIAALLMAFVPSISMFLPNLLF
ncbi:TRAP transporter, DctM subunit [Schinkia azotoformans MEV2011]|uniref:TRAP transporter, DctM subunit n=28 Tax=Schinkia azotoformans TaxID=1454 RepID=A0A072NP88_SCHAZ|nr:TRAP transporter large permease [Schinkia azotoformans]KEF39484.1 TRAP transporter, DctM subunit [Schinkia azotoformans MEV2011]MEC1720375.1 TRAP transporter large permease [Schinkia azotoformans]